MKKKIIAVVLLVALLSSASVFALGLGVQVGGAYPVGGSAAVTFKIDNVPLVFAVNARFGDPLVIGGTADYWIVNNRLAGSVNYFFGIGAGAAFAIGENSSVGLSIRAPIGINMFFAKGVVEPYLQVVPGLGINLNGGNLFGFVFDANLGIRFWF